MIYVDFVDQKFINQTFYFRKREGLIELLKIWKYYIENTNTLFDC